MRNITLQPLHSALILAALVSALVLTACAGSSGPAPTPTLDPGSDAGRGAGLFATYCATCHALAEDVLIVGPSLAHIATTAETRVDGLSAEDYIHDSILYPDDYIAEGFNDGSMQQNFGTQLTSEEVNLLVAFLMTQK